MDLSADELAGIVDLFGALTREELQSAAAELGFKRDGEFDPDTFAADVDAAERSYHLLAVEPDAVTVAADSEGGRDDVSHEGPFLAPGPLAFPALPADAGDLPHILEIEQRRVDQAAAGQKAEERFRRDAARAVAASDTDRIAQLLDVSYELEAWGPVDLTSVRDHLDSARD